MAPTWRSRRVLSGDLQADGIATDTTQNRFQKPMRSPRTLRSTSRPYLHPQATDLVGLAITNIDIPVSIEEDAMGTSELAF